MQETIEGKARLQARRQRVLLALIPLCLCLEWHPAGAINHSRRRFLLAGASGPLALWLGQAGAHEPLTGQAQKSVELLTTLKKNAGSAVFAAQPRPGELPTPSLPSTGCLLTHNGKLWALTSAQLFRAPRPARIALHRTSPADEKLGYAATLKAYPYDFPQLLDVDAQALSSALRLASLQLPNALGADRMADAIQLGSSPQVGETLWAVAAAPGGGEPWVQGLRVNRKHGPWLELQHPSPPATMTFGGEVTWTGVNLLGAPVWGLAEKPYCAGVICQLPRRSEWFVAPPWIIEAFLNRVEAGDTHPDPEPVVDHAYRLALRLEGVSQQLRQELHRLGFPLPSRARWVAGIDDHAPIRGSTPLQVTDVPVTVEVKPADLEREPDHRLGPWPATPEWWDLALALYTTGDRLEIRAIRQDAERGPQLVTLSDVLVPSKHSWDVEYLQREWGIAGRAIRLSRSRKVPLDQRRGLGSELSVEGGFQLSAPAGTAGKNDVLVWVGQQRGFTLPTRRSGLAEMLYATKQAGGGQDLEVGVLRGGPEGRYEQATLTGSGQTL